MRPIKHLLAFMGTAFALSALTSQSTAKQRLSPHPPRGTGAWIESIRRYAPNIASKLQSCSVGRCDSTSFAWCSWKTSSRAQHWTAYECNYSDAKEGWIAVQRENERLTRVNFGFSASIRNQIYADLVRQNNGGSRSTQDHERRILIDKTTLLHADRSSYWNLIKVTPLSEVAGQLDRLWEASAARDGSSINLAPTLLHHERDDFTATATFNAKGEVEALFTCIPVWEAGEDDAVFRALSGTWGTPKREEINFFGATLQARVFRDKWYVVDLRSIAGLKSSQLLLFRTESSTALAQFSPFCEACE